MTHLSANCLFWLTEGEQCFKTPVVADYFVIDELKGERLVTSNCSQHDKAGARREAEARGYVRRERVA